MSQSVESQPKTVGANLESIRLQAAEHPIGDGGEPKTPQEYCLRLIHLKAYAEAKPYVEGKDLLDLGCNDGYGTLGFVNTARSIVGADVSEKAIDAAKTHPGAEHIEFRVIDGLSLPFADDSFDVVISFQVVEHILDTAPYFREIIRVLRPGGIVIFTTPNAATRLFPGMTPWNKFHVREYLAPELEEALRAFFPNVRLQGMFGTPTLYEMELARVNNARVTIRDKALAEKARVEAELARKAAEAERTRIEAERRAAPKPPRPLPIRIAKVILPNGLRRRIRSLTARHVVPTPVLPPQPAVVEATPPPPPAENIAATITLEEMKKFSIADLFYSENDLEKALDFMAICSVEKPDTQVAR